MENKSIQDFFRHESFVLNRIRDGTTEIDFSESTGSYSGKATRRGNARLQLIYYR